MKNKYFLIKIAGILSLLLLIMIYFLLYFMPALKSINRYKRQLKDKNLKVSDFVRMENAFSFSNEREQGYFETLEQELRGKMSEVRTREDFIALFTRISNYIQTLARQDGILNLVLKSDSEELRVNASTLASNKKALDALLNFTTRRLTRLRKKKDLAGEKAGVEAPSLVIDRDLPTLVENIRFHTITLSFTGELRRAVNFINHIPWSSYYLSEDRILISEGDTTPYYIVFLRIYYIDLRGGGGNES